MIRQSVLVLGALASFSSSWAANLTTTQQAEILTSPRPAATTNLLFAFVLTQSGFDTEITISNTSQDTSGSTPQSGTCALTFQGSGTVPPAQTTSIIPAGKQVVFRMSQGGAGIAPAPNLLGFMFAQCTFPHARGVARILGASFLGFSQDAQIVALPRVTTTPTRLLFQFATNQAGYDTGIVIANTSLDPFGTAATSGTCTFNFFGSPARPPVVTPTISAGGVYVNLVASMAPGFQGYVTASCNFRAAAGTAFVTDVGARNIAYAETAEVLPSPRTATNTPLLFSSLTNRNGQDTGITIANTTLDPVGTTAVAGACTMTFFGVNAPAPFVTPTIAAGSVYTSLVSVVAPGFQGYVTAACTFPLARAWAFTRDAGGFVDGGSQVPELVTTPRSATPAPLLFSGVTNRNGPDTTIIISNTSQDLLGSVPVSGACTISYFGDMADGSGAPAPQVSSSIPAGSQLSFSLSAGNPAQGIAARPGFRGYIIADCSFPLARGLANIVGAETVNVTVDTLPSGLAITVDGTSYTAPKTFTWLATSSHTLTTATPQTPSAGTRYSFINWNLGGTVATQLSQTVSPFSSTTYTANFNTEHLLTTAAIPSAGGAITSGGWFLSGALMSLSASANPGFRFAGFSGDLTGLAIPSFLTMNGPKNVVANYSPLGTPGVQNFQQLAIWRASAGLGTFALDKNTSYNFELGVDRFLFFGLSGDKPVAGDWAGTGTVSVGVFRCGATGVCQWYIDLNNNGAWDGVSAGGDAVWNFGLPGDQPIIGDWTGDNISKIGVMRCPASGVCTWYLDAGNKHTYDAATVRAVSYGLTGDIPVANHWGGPGTADQVGIFRCPTPGVGVCQWFVDSNGNGAFDLSDAVYSYGLTGDLPIVGQWSAPGQKRIGVFRNGQVILNVNGSNSFSSNDLTGRFGVAGDIPVVGFWTQP